MNCEVFRRVAVQVVEDNRYICPTLVRATARMDLNNASLYDLFFEFYFRPNEVLLGESWFGPLTTENQLARSLALLLAGELCDDIRDF